MALFFALAIGQTAQPQSKPQSKSEIKPAHPSSKPGLGGEATLTERQRALTR